MRAVIKELKEAVKKEDEYIEKCKEYDKNINFVDSVDISFKDGLDVSAKTINEEIFLNGKLFDENSWVDQMRYIIHEIVHVMQQEAGNVDGSHEEDYLDDENEIEAFQAQLSYMSEHNSPEEIQEYLEQLLDHHGITGKERREKIKELTSEI